MAQFFNKILTKSSVDIKFNTKNSFDLQNTLDNIILHTDDLMVSFDIIAMYEKIPIKLVQVALKKRWHIIQENTPIPWKTFNEPHYV